MAYRDPEVRRARDRERFQRRTAKRIARGLCPRCGQLPPELERSLCAPCGEKRNKAARARERSPVRSSGLPASRAGTRPRRAPASGSGGGGRPPSASPTAYAPSAGGIRRSPAAACANPAARSVAPPIATATPKARRPPSSMAAVIRNTAAGSRANKAASASAPVARSASAPAADRIRPSKAERSASHAATRGARPNANSMPRGGQPVSASSAERRPSTAARAATHAPCARQARSGEEERSRQTALRRAAGPGEMHRLRRVRAGRGAVRALCEAVLVALRTRPRDSGVATAIHRDRARHRGGLRDLRQRGRGRDVPRVREAVPGSGRGAERYLADGDHDRLVTPGVRGGGRPLAVGSTYCRPLPDCLSPPARRPPVWLSGRRRVTFQPGRTR